MPLTNCPSYLRNYASKIVLSFLIKGGDMQVKVTVHWQKVQVLYIMYTYIYIVTQLNFIACAVHTSKDIVANN